ncbi:hypothetical protein HDU79_011004 [Rhizoclosmatium sp. JEL0117]|nr:hypothetical protein HDU79_011004 [Rhizoclosmatium sp. JEL0117]
MQDDLFNFYELFGDGGSSSTDEPLLSTDDHVMFSQFLDNLGGGGVSNSSTAAFDWTTGSGSSSEAPLLAQLFPATTSTTTSPTLPQQHQQHQHHQHHRKRSVDTSASLSIPAAFLSDPPPPATSLLSSSLPKRLKSDLNFPHSHSHSHSQSQAAAFADMLPFFHSQSQQMPQVHIMPPSFNPLYSTSSILPPSSLMQHHYAATYNNQHHHHQQFMPSNHHEGLPTPSPPMHSDPLFKIEPVSHVPALAALPSSALRPTSSDAPAPKRRGGRKPKDSDSINTSSTASSTTTTSANASTTTTKKQSLLSTQEKKQNHILAEQRRRQLIRDALKELTLLVPGLRPPIEGSETSTDGSSRVEILEGSRAFIERLKQENEVMRGLIAASD